MTKDTFHTIFNPVEAILFKEKNSKFIGYAYSVSSEEEVKFHIDLLRKNNPSANHVCYAYQIGVESIRYRANDDGEPSNSAGMPIYGQIQSFGITNVLVAVVRYFGGVKLGVGGLISAYKTAAQLTLNEAIIVKKFIEVQFNISFDYTEMNKVMRIIKEKNLEIISQQMEMNCRIVISTRKSNEDLVLNAFESLHMIKIEKI